MLFSSFKTGFEFLSGIPDPFPWQEELFRRFMTGCVERAIDIPTGLGKTAVMAIWLLARAEGGKVPRWWIRPRTWRTRCERPWGVTGTSGWP
jgi:CRISPR/Cas system-associated endonuclease/helicase Cas3